MKLHSPNYNKSEKAPAYNSAIENLDIGFALTEQKLEQTMSGEQARK
jgi:hypothetical protein